MSIENPVCAVCGAKFEEGKGFVEPHLFPCANDRYGWNFVVEAPTPAPKEVKP